MSVWGTLAEVGANALSSVFTSGSGGGKSSGGSIPSGLLAPVNKFMHDTTSRAPLKGSIEVAKTAKRPKVFDDPKELASKLANILSD